MEEVKTRSATVIGDRMYEIMDRLGQCSKRISSVVFIPRGFDKRITPELESLLSRLEDATVSAVDDAQKVISLITQIEKEYWCAHCGREHQKQVRCSDLSDM